MHVSLATDCGHNNWETARINKKGIATLRCRDCQVQIKKVQSEVVETRCEDFYQTGKCGAKGCDTLHVNQHKQSLEERYSIHGSRVLENVPRELSSFCAKENMIELELERLLSDWDER
eukprot:TRINITY_DN7038_c3_g1_i1.p2 TRINITY_DN7038_c3_g1~~TRINITY_DN7038_c3_g1_i1.p2  ORF type:complete len:118 (+),score=22.96 TRINITY_DN7038_c3_g1_i1:125-478(+)